MNVCWCRSWNLIAGSASSSATSPPCRRVADEGSFGRAAQRLGYTQSAISQQIATLERIVGERLVERPGGPRPVSLTEAGRLLLRHAESIVARLQAAQADLRRCRAGEVGDAPRRHLPVRRREGAAGGHAPLHRAVAAGRRRALVALEDDGLADAVERGELDVGFVQLPVGDHPLETVELLRDPYVLIVPADSPLAERRTVAAARRRRAAGRLPRMPHAVEPIEAAFRAEGLEPKLVFRSNDNPTVQALVAAGVGVAVMPRLTVNADDPRIAVVDLGDAGDAAPDRHRPAPRPLQLTVRARFRRDRAPEQRARLPRRVNHCVIATGRPSRAAALGEPPRTGEGNA